MAKPVDTVAEFAKYASKLKGRQALFARAYLHGDADTAGNTTAAGKAAGYTEGSIRANIAKWLPKPEHASLVDRGAIAGLRDITLAILWGLRAKAEETRKAEVGRAEKRTKLNLTTDRVLRSLLEIAERTAGYQVNPETFERTGAFDPKAFVPGTSQRTFELLGKDMGMFIPKDDPNRKKAYDEMSLPEIDAEIAGLEKSIADIEAAKKASTKGKKLH